MSTITKQWLQKAISQHESMRDEIPFGLDEDDSNTLAALRIALASLEAEPVALRDERSSSGGISKKPGFNDLPHGTPLYTAPPAPVSVPDEAIRSAVDEIMATYAGSADECRKLVRKHIEDACRAAMLQGADGTLTNEGTIPVTQFKPVADLYGLTSPTGGETSFTFDAVEARDFIDGGWSCQEYVELGRYQEALTDHSEGDLDMVRPVMFICGNLLPGDAEKLKAAIEEFNHSGEPTIMIAGDSPVIPDGWVLVPEQPTHEMLEAGDEQFGTYDVYRRMITAAPQQEVK